MAKAELGDVSLNGTITAYDASLILQHTVSNITLTPAQRNVADITKNGAITAYDASQILQYNVGLILTFTPNPSMIRKNVPALASADINFGSITPTTTNGEFIVPIRVNSGSGVKSIDMQLGFNANHLNLTKITSANMNNDISFSNSENFANGNISLSIYYTLFTTSSSSLLLRYGHFMQLLTAAQKLKKNDDIGFGQQFKLARTKLKREITGNTFYTPTE